MVQRRQSRGNPADPVLMGPVKTIPRVSEMETAVLREANLVIKKILY